ncbi:MAG: hypothetical protein R6U98_11970 [Pirellulaceae bacterium]
MPFVLQLPRTLRKAGWKIKIHDAERLEPPHVTIHCKMRTWRLSLRDGRFLDRGDNWNQISVGVRRAIEQNWQALIGEWDAIHPDNPVSGEDDE